MHLRRARVAAVTAMVLLRVAAAQAETPEQDRALATALFNQAKTLLREGKIGPACRQLEESRRLDPLPGTILNLAVCHEQEGLTATAWAELREARVLAVRDRRDDRIELIDEHLTQLEPRLSWLIIDVAPEAADGRELRIARDGTILGRPAWGTRIPVDPGEHVVEASAPGKKPMRVVVAVKGDAETASIAVGALEDADAPPLDVAPPPASAASAERLPPEPRRALSGRRTAALVAAGAGAIGVGVGTFFGVRAFLKHDDPAAICTAQPCSSESVSLNNQAKFAADAATVSFAIGLGALGAGAVLWFGDSSSGARPVTVLPSLTVAGGGLSARGRF